MLVKFRFLAQCTMNYNGVFQVWMMMCKFNVLLLISRKNDLISINVVYHYFLLYSQSGLSADEESLNAYFSLADPDTLRMFDEKAKLLLNEEEESTLNYYRTEYDKGQVTLDAFVAVLLELLNTPDKVCFLILQ